MGYIGANIIAILLAAACGIGVGMLFHLANRRAVDRTPRLPVSVAIVACCAEAWLAAILAGALILAPAAGPGPWVMALASAIVIWIGFVLPTTVVSFLHSGRPPTTTLAYAAHWLVVMVVQAVVLQAVGLARPS